MLRKTFFVLMLLLFCLGTPPLTAVASNGNRYLLIPNLGLKALQVFDPVTRTVVVKVQLPFPYEFGPPYLCNTALVDNSDGTIYTNVRDENGEPTLLAIDCSGHLLAAVGSGGGYLQQIVFDPLDGSMSTVLGGTPFTDEVRAINPFAGTSVARITRTNGNFIGIVVDAAGCIFAGDYSTGEVLKYESNGDYLGTFANVRSTTGSHEINGMTQDSEGNIYVGQNSYARIAKYTPDGDYLGLITNENANRPGMVFYNPEDDLLYVGNAGNDKLVILTTEGDLVDVISMGGSRIGTAALIEPEFFTANQPPTAHPNGPYLFATNVTCDFDGSLSGDPDGDPLTYTWDFGDGYAGTTATPTHIYQTADIYDVCLIVNDGYVDSETQCTIAVVYDPEGGFVTGGGWIWSPVGAYLSDPTLEGKANFGFISKYKKGAEVPTGNTEFVFSAGDLDFHSSSYEWLVVTGSDYARFKGWGSVNGEDGYRFMLWAGDDPDTFRIRIWTEDEITGAEADVYDNGVDQVIGGGSIVIHAK